MSKPPLILSASRIKLLSSCSWLYWCRYQLKLPDQMSDGARRGNCCHYIFELLLKPKHKKHYDSILAANSCYRNKAIERLLNLYFKKENLQESNEKGEANYKMVDQMILSGLKADFFCEGKELEVGELEIKIESSQYFLTGFLDKIAKCPDETRVVIDYKSSKSSGDHSIQALTYSLWVKRVIKADALVRILYLRSPEEGSDEFPTGPHDDYRFTDVELDGFEEYLKSLYVYLENFTEEDAKQSTAYHKGYQKEGGFCGRVMCGRAKEPGQFKKDGTPMWHCSSRFGFNYWHRVKGGKVIESSRSPLVAEEGEEILEKSYKGCPVFQN